jgi:pilus assembly protein CpaB
MSARTIMVVFLALFSGAGMAVGVLRSNQPKAGDAIATETEDVLIAISDIERGRTVTEADVEERKWPRGLAPADTLRTVAEAKGRAAVGRILAGEVVRNVKLATEGAGLGLAPSIPVGKRALTVMASRASTSVAGFVLPGSRVDVLLNLRASGRGDETGGGSTTTLLQAIEVLAVDQKQDAPETNQFDPKALTSVTLLVTPEEANVLDLAQNMGTLSLALRNSSDVSDAAVLPATLAEIRRLSLPPNSSATPYLDGDRPPPPEMMSAAVPRAEKTEPLWILTLRGNQRGRVALTGSRATTN